MRTAAVVLVVSLALIASVVTAQSQPSANDLADTIDKLLASPGTLQDVIRIFGEPEEYTWERKPLDAQHLPDVYLAQYPNHFSILITMGQVAELRHEGLTGFLLEGKIGVGSTLAEVLAVVGPPSRTVTGQPIGREDGVLYKDIDGRDGRHYYARVDKKVRFFFYDGRAASMYQVVRTDENHSRKSRPLTKVSPYDDVRDKDLAKLSFAPRVAATLTFNQATVWPANMPMSGRFAPASLIEAGKNPGLGVCNLHRQGITGKGVNVAIIDQPMYQDHPEFAGKIAAYFDTGCQSQTSMHGPAVTSLLVGQTCGTAPEAKVYYAAVPSWKKDTAYYAQALNWIIEQNNALPEGQKIRVVSVSADPSGNDTLYTRNTEQWDEACRRAEAAGIMVLDCTNHRCFIHVCCYDPNLPEAPARCTPGYPHANTPVRMNCILAPVSLRTTAEQQTKNSYTYIYWGEGGHSWSIPYVAGVLAMGWQINPNATPQQMRELLFRSAVTTRSGAKIINPVGFVTMVKNAPRSQTPIGR